MCNFLVYGNRHLHTKRKMFILDEKSMQNITKMCDVVVTGSVSYIELNYILSGIR